MKKIFIAAVIMAFSNAVFSAIGYFGSPLSSIYLTENGTQADYTADVFNGSNLGTLYSLTLRGGQSQTFKNGGGNVCGAEVYYRIYPQGSPSGAYTAFNFPFDANLGGGGDQRWRQTAGNVDLLAGLTPGDYTIEIYFRISGEQTSSGCSDAVFQSNGGSNYSANFSLPFRSSSDGDFNTTTTWISGSVPSANSKLAILNNVALNTVFLSDDVILTSGNTLTINTGQTLTLTGGVSGSGSLQVNGTLQLNAGGFTSVAPSYGVTGSLVYNTSGTYGRGTEWSSTSGAGYPNNVTISNNTTLDLGANGGTNTARECAGNLTVNAGSALSLNASAMSQPLTVKGNFINNGTVTLSSVGGGDLVLEGDFDDNGTFTANGRAVFFQGGNNQNINSTTDPLEIDVMRINKSGGEVIMDQNLLADETADPIQLNSASSVLNLNGNTLTIGKAGVTSSGTFTAGAALKGSSTSGLVILGDGAFGSIPFVSGFSELNNLTVDRGASGGIEISSDLTVSGTATLTNGNITTGSANVIIPQGATIAETGGEVVGNLQVTRNLSASTLDNFSSMGMSITPAGNMGVTTVTRNNTSGFTSNAETSMDIHYDVAPTNNGAATITFTYSDALLGGRNEDSLKLFKSVDGSADSWFQLLDNFAINTTSNEITVDVPSFSLLTTHDQASFAEEVLPVELIEFKATATEQGVELSWLTASEINNRGFAIQKSFDAIHFDEIGFVSGNGTSSSLNAYSFIDFGAKANESAYYRLKQLDFDGAFEYSSVVRTRAQLEMKDKTADVRLLSNGNLLVQSEHSAVFMELFSVGGQRVLEQNLENQQQLINLSGVKAGVYVVRLYDEFNQLSTYKVVKP